MECVSGAKAVLIHVEAHSGCRASSFAERWRISTLSPETADLRPLKFSNYVYCYGYSQSAVAVVSTQFWLPLMDTRTVLVERTMGGSDATNFYSSVAVIGFR